MLLTPTAVTPQVLAQCGEKGIRGAIVAAAGVREGGEEGAALEQQLLEVARRSGIRFLGPNSLGLIRTDSRLNAACGPPMPRSGRLALVSQSGALCSAMLDWAETSGVGFSTVISTGIGDDVDLGEILDFLARDGATDSIMLYMERIADARRFMSALRAAARVKPVVVIKAGRAAEAEPGAAAFGSAPVAADDVFDAALRRAGVLRIRAFQQLYSAAGTLATGARLAGRRLAIVMNAGGPGQLAADRAADRGLQLAALAPPTLASLQSLLPPSAARGNPVYVRSDASARQFGEAVRLALEDPHTDALLAVVAPFALSDADEYARQLIAAVSGQKKPAFTCWMGDASMMASRRRFAENRIPTYRTPEAAVDAIAALALYTSNQEQLLQVPTPLGPASAPDVGTAQRLIDDALAADREWLDPAQSARLLAAFGIAVGDEASTGLVARHVPEFMIGVVRDPVFGPVISFGLGGAMADVIRDRAVALPPLNPFLARELVGRTRASAALQPGRGAPAAARAVIEQILLRVAELVCELPDVLSLELNPVLVTPRAAVVGEARIGVVRSLPGALPYRHMAIHPYPSGLEGTLELPGEEIAVVRPIRPEDARLERDFVQQLSEESRYL
ncbi:MAG: acetate--CoA ligase family protein, partial [Steroidobacteraceae bacterium]